MAQQELFGGRPNNALPDDIEELNRLFKERAAANPEWSTFAFIPGEGPKGSRVAVVGESPGPPDIQSGRPFMGPAGDMLVRILNSINLHRRDCYLTNGIKLVTTGEQITSQMIRFFAPLLSHELTLVDPAVIICFGNTSTQMLLGSKKTISATRGQFHTFQGIPVMPTFNPAYLLRDPTKKREVWEDMKKVRMFLASRQER